MALSIKDLIWVCSVRPTNAKGRPRRIGYGLDQCYHPESCLINYYLFDKEWYSKGMTPAEVRRVEFFIAKARKRGMDVYRPPSKSQLNCFSKVFYETEEEAQEMAKHYRQRAYCCPHCDGYHLTSQKKDKTND